MVGELDPLRDLLVLQERINRLFEDALSGEAPLLAPSSPVAFTPAADVWETADSFVALVELPGVSPDDVIVQVDGDELRLRGERRAATPCPEHFLRMERSHGAFVRSFRTGQPLDADKVRAELRDGLLRLEVAKLGRPSRRAKG
ncbi:MAG: Hsp20/alpha crystallin family protein [Vicinamibacteria bacterium]